MSGLPRKYAKMGFSKGWKAYRKSNSSRNTTSAGETMKRRSRVSRSGGFKRFARRTAHKAGIGKSVQLFQMDAMIYGGLRNYASNALTPVTNMLPVPYGLGDEVVMGGLNYLIAKNTSGMISDIAKKGLIIENARVGEAIANIAMGGQTSTAGTTGASSAPVYG